MTRSLGATEASLAIYGLLACLASNHFVLKVAKDTAHLDWNVEAVLPLLRPHSMCLSAQTTCRPCSWGEAISLLDEEIWLIFVRNSLNEAGEDRNGAKRCDTRSASS